MEFSPSENSQSPGAKRPRENEYYHAIKPVRELDEEGVDQLMGWLEGTVEANFPENVVEGELRVRLQGVLSFGFGDYYGTEEEDRFEEAPSAVSDFLHYNLGDGEENCPGWSGRVDVLLHDLFFSTEKLHSILRSRPFVFLYLPPALRSENSVFESFREGMIAVHDWGPKPWPSFQAFSEDSVNIRKGLGRWRSWLLLASEELRGTPASMVSLMEALPGRENFWGGAGLLYGRIV